MVRSRRHRVATVIVDGMMPLEPAVSSEVFDIDRSDELGVTWYEHRFVTPRPGRVHLRGGLDLWVEHDLSWASRADTVIVPWRSDSLVVVERSAVVEVELSLDSAVELVLSELS